MAWAATVPLTLRNPLYHWTHLELKNPFGITDKLLDSKTAESIYDHCNALLHRPEFSTCGLLEQMNVRIVCTTDDPADSLEYHRQISGGDFCSAKVVPTFRPDKAMAVDDPESYNVYLETLGEVSGRDITTYTDLLDAVSSRHDFFHQHGCRLSDHGLEQPYYLEYSDAEISRIFEKHREWGLLNRCLQLEVSSL